MNDRIKVGDRITFEFYALGHVSNVVGTVEKINGSYYYANIHYGDAIVMCEKYEHEMTKITEEEYFIGRL
jgi:co-chaperonin GroES (HSP10)